MKLTGYCFLAAVIAVVLVAASDGSLNTTARPAHGSPFFEVVGRTEPIQELDNALAFDFSGVTLRFEVTGVESITLAMAWRRQHAEFTDAMPHRFTVTANGAILTPIPYEIDTSKAPVAFPPKFVDYPIASGLNASERYVIEVLHISEPNLAQDFTPKSAPFPNWVAFGNVTLLGAKPTFHSIAEKEEAKKPKRRIEFIGDSITAGFCNLCKVYPDALQAKAYQLQSFAYSWAHAVCRSLDATCHTEAWSGMGILRDFNLNTSVTLMDVFFRSLGSDPTSTWNFSKFVPDAVVMNLGTNDFLARTTPEFVDKFVERYVLFVNRIHSVYQPRSPTFFLACGPLNDEVCSPVFEVLRRVSKIGIKARFLDQRNLVTPETMCCRHPDTRAEFRMAVAARDAIRKAMGWMPL